MGSSGIDVEPRTAMLKWGNFGQKWETARLTHESFIKRDPGEIPFIFS
jgi:hypothetical protein